MAGICKACNAAGKEGAAVRISASISSTVVEGMPASTEEARPYVVETIGSQDNSSLGAGKWSL